MIPFNDGCSCVCLSSQNMPVGGLCMSTSPVSRVRRWTWSRSWPGPYRSLKVRLWEGKGKIRFEVENKDVILIFKSQPFSSTYSNDVATLRLWKDLSSENGFNPCSLCVFSAGRLKKPNTKKLKCKSSVTNSYLCTVEEKKSWCNLPLIKSLFISLF